MVALMSQNNEPQRRWVSDYPTEELASIRTDKRRNRLAWCLVAALAVLILAGIAALVYILVIWR